MISAALTFLNRNSVSVVMTASVLGLFGVWVAVPESSTLDGLYERYLAKEELKPRVFENGIAVRLNREAPPVAALEEALREQPWTTIESNPSTGIAAIALHVGTSQVAQASEAMASRILASNRQLWDRIEKHQGVVRQIVTSGPSIGVPLAYPPRAPSAVLPNLQTTPIAPPVRVARPSGIREGVSFAQAQGARTSTLSKTNRRLEEFSIQPTDSASPKTISLSKTGLTRDQLLAALFLPFSDSNPNGNKPSASRNIFQPNPIKPVASTPSSGTTIASASRASASQRVKPEPTLSENQGAREMTVAEVREIAARASGALAPAGRQIMIRGPLELSGGLALTHARDRIAVVRESRGQFIESGSVWIREARYEIFVESMEGHLVAEVRSPQGEVVGRGQIALSSLETSDQRKTLEGVVLKVQPVATGIAGRVQSAYSSSSTGTSSGARSVSRGIAGAKVDFLQTPSGTRTVSGGMFEETKFAEGSRVIASVSAKDHWPTLANLMTGVEPVVPIFSKKMMEAFVSLTAPPDISPRALDELKEEKGVVWGRVTRGANAVSGATVEVLTEGIGEPVYFNDLMLPDPKMKATGPSGLFAIPAASEGLHALQVHLGKRISDPVYVQAQAQSVVALELDVLKASEVEGRVYEAFRPEKAIEAELRVMGHVKSRRMNIAASVDSQTASIVKLAHLGMPSILDVAAGAEYLAVRVIQNPETRYLDVPLVTRSWYDGVLARMRYNSPPATGNVIGFIQGLRYRVMVEEESLTERAKVVYFDDRGEMISQEYGVPGGGFMLLGLKDGLRTVLIEAEGSGRVYAVTVLVQEGVPAMVSHWLR